MKNALTIVSIAFASCLAAVAPVANATEYALPAPDSRLIGENITATVASDGSSLEAVAATYKIGLLAMLEANPGTDPYLPQPGTVLTTAITQKIPNPTWTPTPNIRKHYLAEQGITLPAMVPAGPDNPMGLFALRLAAGKGAYLIHGTNANFGIGMRVSSGCIRLRPDDIEALFNRVPVGTRVQVLNDAVKIAVEPDGKRYMEVHQPLSRSDRDDPQTMPIGYNGKVKKFLADPQTDPMVAKQAIERRSGMPIVVSTGVAPEAPPAQPAAAAENRSPATGVVSPAPIARRDNQAPEAAGEAM